MLLAIDVGNTNIVFGVFEGKNLRTHYRISTTPPRTSDEYGNLFLALLGHAQVNQQDISDVIISTVVPPLTDALREMARQYFKSDPIFVGPGLKIGLNIKYENPKEVGADRIVNAVAAFSLYGGPIIIVDFGTATTFCAVSAEGEYLGGAIAPGIMISVEALFRAAARLSRVELKKPSHVIGKNTVESMQSGIFFGYVGQVDEIVRRIREQMTGTVRVIATGGMARLISEESSTIQEVCPLLTLEGLRILQEKNRKPA